MENVLHLDSGIGTPSFNWRQLLRDFYDLSKPGIGFYSLITTAAAFWLASAEINIPLLIHTILATGLVTCGGGALNQVIEVEADGQMRRTENRPLPSGRIPLMMGLAFGVGASIAGVLYMLIFVGSLAAMLSVATLAGYLFVYTPLKKKTHLSTLIGAFPGAFPILIGWVAVRGSIDMRGWTLFAILFLWQIPHFLAIAWMYRKDYARAGFPMLTVVDPEGSRTSFQVLSYVLALIPVSLLPTLLHMTGPIYFVGALAIGIGFAVAGIRTAALRSNAAAKQLLFASIIYLPVLLALMVFDKI
ncbi:MAG TPA: heme o synthase [Candidatus Kapabacteria bacterium]|jgi:protoheme IX farnesyltransferase|nr:heme o synthase [Candidatus Kapabacteria bacterium]